MKYLVLYRCCLNCCALKEFAAWDLGLAGKMASMFCGFTFVNNLNYSFSTSNPSLFAADRNSRFVRELSMREAYRHVSNIC